MANNQSQVGKGCGIACLGILGLVALGSLASAGGGGVIAMFVVIGLIVFAIVKNNKKNVAPPTLKVNNPNQAPDAYIPPYATPSIGQRIPVEKKEFETGICGHSFSPAELKNKETIVCACGYEFEVPLLRECAKLQRQLSETEKQLDAVWEKLKQVPKKPLAAVKSTPVAAPQVAASMPVKASTPIPAPKVAAPVKVAAPKPVVKRKKVSLQPQQWLIMGASVLIVIAGGIFVSTNLTTLNQYQFLGVTVGVALVTGFLSFWGRKFSVMLSNFMATFSSSMQIATLIVIGDLLFPFAWDSAPAWWWGIDLLIVSGLSLLLARFKANFGWKVISLVGFVVSVLFFLFGPVKDYLEADLGQFGYFAAISTASAVALALISKVVRTFKYVIPKDSQDSDYEKDLAKREDSALERFTLVAASALAILGIGYSVYAFLNGVLNLEPISFSVFSLVWIGAGAVQKVWVPSLTGNEKVQDQINRWEHVVGFASAALALNAWFKPLGLWPSLIATVVLSFVAVFLGYKSKRISDHPVAIRVAHYALLGSWLLWSLPMADSSKDKVTAIGVLLILFSLSLLMQHVLKFDQRTANVAMVGHVLGLGLLAFRLRSDDVSIQSMQYSFIALSLILLSVLYSPLVAYVAKKNEKEASESWQNFVLVLSSVLIAALCLPFDAQAASSKYLNILSMLYVSALVVGLIPALLKSLAEEVKRAVSKYGFVFQGAIGFVLVSTTRTVSDLSFTSSALLAVAALNYLFALTQKSVVNGRIGYAVGLVGLGLTVYAQRDVLLPSAHLGITLVVIILLNYFQLLVAKRTETKHSAYLAFATSFGFTVFAFLVNLDKWSGEGIGSEILIGLAELVVVAILSAGLAERKVTEKTALLLRVNSLAYLVFAYFSFASLSEPVLLKKMLLSFIFSIVVFRQLLSVSKAEDKSVTRGWFLLSYLGPVLLATQLSAYLQDNLNATGLLVELYSMPLAVALATPTFFNRSIPKGSRALTALDIPVVVLGGLQIWKGILLENKGEHGILRIAIVLIVLAGFAYWRSVAEKQIIWVGFGYIAGAVGSLALAYQIQTTYLNSADYPELYSVLVSLSLIVGSVFLVKRRELTQKVRNLIQIDLPVLVPIAGSIFFGLSQGLGIGQGLERVLISVFVLASFAYWRSVAEKQVGWVIVGYFSGMVSALTSGYEITQRYNINDYPEIYTALISLSLVIGSLFLFKRSELTEVQKQLARIDIPLLLPVIVSIGYALSQGLDSIAILLRLTLSLLLVSAYGHFKIGKFKTNAWAVLTYAGVVGTSLSVVQLLYKSLPDFWTGPEIYSLALAGAIFVGNYELSRVFEFKTTLVKVGLPLAALLLPSVIYSYNYLPTPFALLTSIEITRVILLLVISLVALILGVRAGNLGSTVAGGSALTLLVLPFAWVRAGDAETIDTTISLRSLVVALILFALLGGLRRANRVPETSYLYIGIPVMVAIGPSLYLTIAALGHPTLRNVDWWRFGIIVTVSLVLLIIGALRELGGMFFPGLLGIFVGALPYAFKPIAQQGGLLWVVLLLIAAIMVWIAVRLEQMRKLGKSSVSWVKALK